MANTITFVSLGPGEPELITLKGLRTLKEADIIYCPSTTLKNTKVSSRALDILLALDIDQAKVQLFDVPMSKDRTLALASYAAVSKLIHQAYLEGKNVAVTAEGDAGFYSSSHYIIDNLKRDGVVVDKIPGVPAFISAGALAHIHIAMQKEELHVVPGVITTSDLVDKIEKHRAVVIMKASQSAEDIKQAIHKAPQSTFHYFENVGLDTEYYTTDIEEIINRKFPYFSLLIIKS